MISALHCFPPVDVIMIYRTKRLEFFLNVFHWIQRIQWQKIYNIKRTRTCHPATSCVRDQHATTAPPRHMWEIGSLNWAQFMLQWFFSFSEFTEFSERSAPFRKNSISFLAHSGRLASYDGLAERICLSLSNAVTGFSQLSQFRYMISVLIAKQTYRI